MNILHYYILLIILIFVILAYISMINKKKGKVNSTDTLYDDNDLYNIDTFNYINSTRNVDNSAIVIEDVEPKLLESEIVPELPPISDDVIEVIDDNKKSVKKPKKTIKSNQVDSVNSNDSNDELQTTDKLDISSFMYSLKDVSNSDLFSSTEEKLIISKINDSIALKKRDILIIINNKTNAVDDILFDSYADKKQNDIIDKVKLYLTKQETQYTIIYIASFGLIKGYLNEKIKLDRLVL